MGIRVANGKAKGGISITVACLLGGYALSVEPRVVPVPSGSYISQSVVDEGPPQEQANIDTRFKNARRRLSPAIVLLGHPSLGHGSGFVISRKNRLIATAGHVADHSFDAGKKMLAVLDGTSKSYRVDRVWYHPAIMRWLDDGLVARSDDPKDGAIANSVPDVAVVQISRDGPEVPAECEMAEDDVLNHIDGKLVGLLGFPSKEGEGWPVGMGRPATASFTTSRVDKTTDFFNVAEAPVSQRQGLWCTTPNFGEGSSGCPIFLEDGHVVGIMVQAGPEQTEIGYGGSRSGSIACVS